MTAGSHLRGIASAGLIIAASSVAPSAMMSQGAPPGGGIAPAMREANQLDLKGETTQARVIFQKIIDTASVPAAKAAAQRAVAMSYAFDGDCSNTVKYESMVIDYWKTREQTEPQNAFYQEGEMANEAARVCIDAGDLAAADQWYRRGYELGVKEPAPQTHPRSLWDYRLAHALGRLAARKGDKAEAERQITKARQILDSDTAMAAQQERFFPYLVGYVALYTNDLATAEAQLSKAVAMKGNERDPFMHCLLAMTYERMGRQSDANAMYKQAYDMATGHNPPAAFVRPFVRKKLGTSAVTASSPTSPISAR
jgi:tetratricopeptide (TPR) repeat protein